jgi:P pilus assembly chaperone PapD
MNRDEAKQLLVDHLQPYVGEAYQKLREFVGSEHVKKITLKNGTEYYFQLDVAPANENEEALIVDGLITEVNGRRLLPPVEQATFTITPDEKITHISPELL